MNALTTARLRGNLPDTWQHNRAYNVGSSMYVGRIWPADELNALCMIPNGDRYRDDTRWAVIYNKSGGHVGWVSFADLVINGSLQDCYHGSNLGRAKLYQTTAAKQFNRAYNTGSAMNVGTVWDTDDLVALCYIPNGDYVRPTTSWGVMYNKSGGYVGWVSWAYLTHLGGPSPDCYHG